ncbi:amidohydrolase family protein [Endozoicomonas sp.]|uniref:amidohydrolase family protein n=1 Tax=Endozoicomonas sp. TaxID=1892382 RepID=UPI0028869217|nr:amidohydrolase family protein [Endozoicomonas sp.]
MLSETGTEAEIVDLDGKMLLPGFIEVHGHFSGSGLTEVSSSQKNVLLQVIGMCSPVAK